MFCLKAIIQIYFYIYLFPENPEFPVLDCIINHQQNIKVIKLRFRNAKKTD